MSIWSQTYQQSVFKCYQWQPSLRVLPTRWRQKSTGIDMEQNYVTVTLCICHSLFPCLAHSASNKPKVGYMFCWFFKYIFSDFFQTNYLYIHLIDLYEIYKDGITLAVDERPKLFFRSLEGYCHGNQLFVDCIFMSHQISETAWDSHIVALEVEC